MTRSGMLRGVAALAGLAATMAFAAPAWAGPPWRDGWHRGPPPRWGPPPPRYYYYHPPPPRYYYPPPHRVRPPVYSAPPPVYLPPPAYAPPGFSFGFTVPLR